MTLWKFSQINHQKPWIVRNGIINEKQVLFIMNKAVNEWILDEIYLIHNWLGEKYLLVTEGKLFSHSFQTVQVQIKATGVIYCALNYIPLRFTIQKLGRFPFWIGHKFIPPIRSLLLDVDFQHYHLIVAWDVTSRNRSEVDVDVVLRLFSDILYVIWH